MKKIFSFVFACALSALLTIQAQPVNPQQLEASLRTHISILASDKFEGRESGTPGEQLAVEYISEQFKAIGLLPKGTNGYIQRFDFSEKDPADSTKKIATFGQNVIGLLDNKARHTIIIGAHLDHLGYGHAGSSLHNGERAIHNGADDNASGTAAVIEMARYLKKAGSKNNNYLFIGFSGEEKGLIGSSHFSKNPTIDLSSVNYMINMDMIGRFRNDEKTLAIYGTGTSPLWNEILPGIQIDSIQIKTTPSGVGPSDHTSFYLKDIPVLHFFSGFHPDYHKPGDDENKINYKGEVSIIKYILAVIEKANSADKIAFTKTKDEPVASKNTPRPKISLGVIPDYMFSGPGLKIDGTTEGKPASAAGLKAGDIIMKIGDQSIADMSGYMKALHRFNPGDETTLQVQRGKETLDLKVSFPKPELSSKHYRIYSAKRNKEIPLDSLIADMKNYDVLFFGEEHNDSVTHYLERLTLEKMNEAYTGKVTLSMEMFDRESQNVMNEYLKGFIREKNFKTDARVWSNYRDYRPMVEYSKEKGLDVICANAPSRYTNLAGRKGQKVLNELPALSKTFFAPLPYDTAQGKYHDKLMEMSGHSPAPVTDTAQKKPPVMSMGNFSLVTAQSLWDATMAYSISEYRKKNPAKKILQVNGKFHSDEGFAVVTQLKKYSPSSRVLIISSGSDEAFPAIDWTKYKNVGDYMIITDPSIPRTYDN